LTAPVVSANAASKWVALPTRDDPGGGTEFAAASVAAGPRRRSWRGAHIAGRTGLRRAPFSRIRDLGAKSSGTAYEHPRSGGLLHLEIKKLVKIAHPHCRVSGTAPRYCAVWGLELPTLLTEPALSVAQGITAGSRSRLSTPTANQVGARLPARRARCRMPPLPACTRARLLCPVRHPAQSCGQR
jgi:hypothetical protein